MTQATILIATRGSALALAQANTVLAECSRKFPKFAFALKIIKSTGDRLQAIPMSRIDATLPRGLFTKELEVALLKGRADMAVHSLKDLPTQLPDGLILGAVAGKRADVRDVLIYRDVFKPKTHLADFPPGLVLATSSTRRKAQILARGRISKWWKFAATSTPACKNWRARPVSMPPSWPPPDWAGFICKSPPADV